MIVSVNWLKKYTKINLPVDELVKLIGARLVEIEEVIDLAPKYNGILVAKVVECENLENSDHLHLTKLDDGGVAKNVERDENGLVQVVCGAPNIAAGQMVAWLPPETVVPETYGKDNFELQAKPLRGVMSYGMIASARELDLFDEHDGILVLDDDLKAGTTFATAYELDDVLLDIENKSLTHRPDCFGIIGFAREIAAIQGNKFDNPDWFDDIAPVFDDVNANKLELTASIDDDNIADRYQAIVISNASGQKFSPLLIQTYLARVGVRPISALVDVTNYLMLLSGQPLHAFDYDKLVQAGNGRADIHVRKGKSGETLQLLDGKNIEVGPGDIVIAAGETAIGLAGAMGGANTMIDEHTQNIVLESATFNLYNLRGTQMRHGIFSEAITRFTKGQPAGLTAPVLKEAVELVSRWAGGTVSSAPVDCRPVKAEPIVISMPQTKVNAVLGTDFDVNAIVKPLENCGFQVNIKENDLEISVPWWRNDIHIPEDVVEEVARIYGYDNIAPSLPLRSFEAVKPSGFDEFRARVRHILARAGANEVLSYTFIHGDTLKKAGLEVSGSYKIVNSISPRLQYYRQALIPSLLELIHPNIKQGYDKFALFEVNKVHHRSSGLNEEGVPVEIDSLALVVTDKVNNGPAQYYLAKHMLDYLAQQLNITLKYTSIAEDEVYPYAASLEPKRRSRIVVDGSSVGAIGEFKRSVSDGFKLPKRTAGFEIDTRSLYEAWRKATPKYRPLSRYPSMGRDICFRVDNIKSYGDVYNATDEALGQLNYTYTLNPVDIFQAADSETKNITLHIELVSYDHTLDRGEVNDAVDKVISHVCVSTAAEAI